MLDGCALILVGLRDVRTFPAKMNCAVARLGLVELCRVFDVQPRSPATARLSSEEFRFMLNTLNQTGLLFSDEKGAEERLAAFRATYDPFLISLSDYLIMPLPGWLPNQDLDNWQNSPRGRSAKQLVESAPAKPV